MEINILADGMEAEDASGSQKWRFRCMGQGTMKRLLGGFVEERRHCSFKGHVDAHHISYKRFRRRIVQRSSADCPVASTPLAAGRQCVSRFEFDTVCQRLALDSPPRDSEKSKSAQDVSEGSLQETALEAGGVFHCATVTPPATPCATAARGMPEAGNAPEQDWVWTAAAQGIENVQRTGTDDKMSSDVQPFAALNKACMRPQDKAVMKLSAPSLLNDYYTNLLDCSSNGTVALALGSSVYLWNSETLCLEGRLQPSPPQLVLTQPGRPGRRPLAISSLCWSRDGRALSIGTRRGEIQLWDVEHKSSMRCLTSHLSVVGALSWKRPFLSSGSVLGRIHHHDPRAPTPLVGVALQQDGVCSLEWSPGEDRLASGSADGLLSVWDGDVTGFSRSRRPVVTMKQPSAVKAMAWCPWQRQLIATGGGWGDGDLRIWDSQSGICINSAQTNSQICSLRWAEKKRALVTGHGPPHHLVTCWAWKFPSVSPSYHLAGHSHRVLHLALSPCGTLIFSAGADQCVHIWAL